MPINIPSPGIYASETLRRDSKASPRTGQEKINANSIDISRIRRGVISALYALGALYCVYSTDAKADGANLDYANTEAPLRIKKSELVDGARTAGESAAEAEESAAQHQANAAASAAVIAKDQQSISEKCRAIKPRVLSSGDDALKKAYYAKCEPIAK